MKRVPRTKLPSRAACPKGEKAGPAVAGMAAAPNAKMAATEEMPFRTKERGAERSALPDAKQAKPTAAKMAKEQEEKKLKEFDELSSDGDPLQD